MKKLPVIAVVISLAAVVASPAVAWAEMRRGHGHAPDYAEAIIAAPGLNLSDTQITKLNTLREVHLQVIEPIQRQMHRNGDAMRFLWLERKPDQEKIRTIQNEVRTLRNKRNEKQAAYRLEVQKVLTPEQQAKIQTHGPRRGYGHRMNYGPGVADVRDTGKRGDY